MWRCPNCGGTRIVADRGEFVCSSCGLVLGYAAEPHQAIVIIRRESRHALRLGYSRTVMSLVGNWLAKRGLFHLVRRAWLMYRSIPLRHRFRNPRVIAAAIIYELAKEQGLTVSQGDLAREFGVSRLSIRDALTQIRKSWVR